MKYFFVFSAIIFFFQKNPFDEYGFPIAESKVFVIKNFTDVKGNNGIRQIRLMYMVENTTTPMMRDRVSLIRGIPMFAEIDFVPRYFPTSTTALVASVLIPETIRRSRFGGPWIIGWNQEKIDLPVCRLCTNFNQSYTIPVTLFLPDDGWCSEGPVPTGWKIESQLQMSTPFSNSDMTVAMVVDEWAQIAVKNTEDSKNCNAIREMINYTVPSVVITKNNNHRYQSTTTNKPLSTTVKNQLKQNV